MLDTLAQTGTKKTSAIRKPPVMVAGNGSDLTDEKLMKRRGEKKMITQYIIKNLLKVAEAKKDKEFIKSLWNTYYCQTLIRTSSDRAYSNYCKNKFCIVCLGNRKAVIINKYLPVLKTWKNPHLVTLTIKSVPAKKLKWIMEKGMIRAFRILTERCKKRNQRGKGKPLVGIKSLECCFNPKRRSYNPHFHLIVPDRETAVLLVSEWLQIWTPKFAGEIAQDFRPLRNLEKGLIEIVKYGTKIFTQPDPNKQLKGKANSLLYASALYNILKAMEGHRLFDRFGFNLPKATRTKKRMTKELTQYEDWKHELSQKDWANVDTGGTLTNFLPPPGLITFLCENVNLELE